MLVHAGNSLQCAWESCGACPVPYPVLPFSFLISPCILWPVCSVFAPSQLHILQPCVLVLLTINAHALALGFSDTYLIYWVFARSCFFGTGSLRVHLVIMYHKDMCDLEMS